MRKDSTQSLESRMKISEAKTGVPKSPETRARMSESKKRLEDERKREKIELDYLRSLSPEDRLLLRSILESKELLTRETR